MRRDRRAGARVAVQVDVSPAQGPGLLGADPAQQAQHDLGVHQFGQAGGRLSGPSQTGARPDALRAAIRGIGHLPADRHEFTLPVRQSRRPDVQLHHQAVRPDEWIVLHGMPVTRPSRIAADLLRSAASTASLQRMQPGPAALAPGACGIRSGGYEVGGCAADKGSRGMLEAFDEDVVYHRHVTRLRP